MAITATQLWIVEYTSIGNKQRTSFFFDEKHAQQWFDYCAKDDRANPTLWTSAVNFTAVAPT